jgi:hypothetical protein
MGGHFKMTETTSSIDCLHAIERCVVVHLGVVIEAGKRVPNVSKSMVASSQLLSGSVENVH